MADKGESAGENELVQWTSTTDLSVPDGEDLDLVKHVLQKMPKEVVTRVGDKQDYFTRKNLSNKTRTDPNIVRDNGDIISTKPNIFVVGEYDGLVVERAHFNWDGSDEYRVKNPTTDEIVLKLPNPTPQEKAEHHNSVFDHNHSNGEAKLLHECLVPLRQNRVKNCLAILTIGRDTNWRRLNFRARVGEKSTTSGRQNIHFFEFSIKGQEMNLRVRTFDLRRESLEENTLCLNTIFQDLVRPCLFFWENRLAVGNMTSDFLQVMELQKQDHDQYGEYFKWGGHDQKITAVISLTFFKKDYYIRRREKIFPLKFASGELWFEIGKEEKFCYDVEVNEIKQTVREGDQEETFLFDRHERNLERLKLLEEQERKR